LFSSELARRYGDEGIVSISLYPGAINADLSGATTTSLRRTWIMVVTIICFLVQGGALDAITDDVRHVRPDTDLTTTSERPSQHPSEPIAPLALTQDHLTELSGTSYRAITSLYAGTEPAAGQLNGRASYPVSALIVFGIPTYWMW
jgi:hypothetical protein